MRNSRADPELSFGWSGKLPSLSILPALVLIVASLYWAQAFLLPIALAVLLTFLLVPVVTALENLGLRRVPSVLLVVIIVFSLLGIIGWIVALQLNSVANQLPTYRDNIRQKIADVRGAGKGSAWEKMKETAKEVKKELEKAPSSAPQPRPVIVQGEESTTFWPISPSAASMFDRLAGAGFVIVLVVFMLIRRENLRNRLIRLLGYGRLTITTKAMEEAGRGITRYLVTQSLLNTGFGIAVAAALLLIGLPYALLWGFLGALLRFIPYVGSMVAATLPTVLSLAVFDGWFWPMLVLGVIVALELLNGMILEPLLYGESAGVSEVGLLVAIAFWTWLWGPLGLLLATPLTVCVVVISKHVPQLEFIDVLMSDERIVDTDIIYYQRLLAMDRAEAKEIIEDHFKSHPAEQVFDELMVPALTYAKRDFSRGRLTEADEQLVFQSTREILAEVESLQPKEPSASSSAPIATKNVPSKSCIMGCPAKDEGDEVALAMFSRLLDPSRYEMEIVAVDSLISEIIEKIAEKNPALLCIASLPPDGLNHTRSLCKRVRQRFPDLQILVGRWGNDGEDDTDQLLSAGANKIGKTIIESWQQVGQVNQLTGN